MYRVATTLISELKKIASRAGGHRGCCTRLVVRRLRACGTNREKPRGHGRPHRNLFVRINLFHFNQLNPQTVGPQNAGDAQSYNKPQLQRGQL